MKLATVMEDAGDVIRRQALLIDDLVAERDRLKIERDSLKAILLDKEGEAQRLREQLLAATFPPMKQI